MNPAKHAREDKEKHPEKYCTNPRCLWRKSSGECPKHSWGPPPDPKVAADKRTIFYEDF